MTDRLSCFWNASLCLHPGHDINCVASVNSVLTILAADFDPLKTVSLLSYLSSKTPCLLNYDLFTDAYWSGDASFYTMSYNNVLFSEFATVATTASGVLEPLPSQLPSSPKP